MKIIIRNLSEDEYSDLLALKKAINCKRWDCVARAWIRIFEMYLKYSVLHEENELTRALDLVMQGDIRRLKKMHTWRGLLNEET